MDEHLSEQERQRLLKKMDKAGQKLLEKLWTEIDLPMTLAGGLAKQTKAGLDIIRSNLGIYGVSTLKKQELVDRLEQQIPLALPALFRKFDETQYKILKQIADRGGRSTVPLEFHQLFYFKNRGILFTGMYQGKRTLVMPQEIVACFKQTDWGSLRETIKRNTEWVKLTQGMLFYNGALSMTELLELLEQYTGKKPGYNEYYFILEEAIVFYEEMNHTDAGGYANNEVLDPVRVMKEHEARPDLSFYPFTKTQLMQAGEPDFVDRNPSYTAFVDFIKKNYSIPREEADLIVEECTDAIRNDKPTGSVLEFLRATLEIEEMELIKAFMNHIMLLHNNTRQWELRGYSPSELSGVRNAPTRLQPTKASKAATPVAKGEVLDFATGKKVGRNDPCPCGSGKKFKKCCG